MIVTDADDDATEPQRIAGAVGVSGFRARALAARPE
jgi:hypothetical protein